MNDETKKTEEKEETLDVPEVKETATVEPEVAKDEARDSSVSPQDTSAEAEVEVPKEFKKIVEEIEGMSVLQLNELVKVFEAKFGVSATAVATTQGGSGDGGGDEEQDSFIIELTNVGDQKIAVIKVVKEVTGLGLKEAKDLVEGAPQVVKEGVKKEEANELKTKFEEAGATITLK